MMTNKFCASIFFTFLLTGSAFTYGQRYTDGYGDTLKVDGPNYEHLSRYSEFWIDTTKNATIAQAAEAYANGAFQHWPQNTTLSTGINPYPLWLHLNVCNVSEQSNTYWWSLYTHADSVWLFSRAAGEAWQLTDSMSFYTPASHRKIKTRFLASALNLQPSECRELLIRVKNKYEAQNITMELATPLGYMFWEQGFIWHIGIFIGCFALVMILNLLFGIITGESTFFIYALYIAVFCVVMLWEDLLIVLLPGDNLFRFLTRFHPLALTVIGSGLHFFVITYMLGFERKRTRLYRIFARINMCGIVYGCVIMLIHFFFRQYFHIGQYGYMVIWYIGVGVVVSLVALLFFTFISTAGDRKELILGIAAAGLLLYFNPAGYYLNYEGFLDYYTLTFPNYFYWTLCVEFLVLGYFIAWRYRETTRRNFQLQQEHLQVATLQEVDRLKSRFLAGISHEFRTPLTLILGHARDQLQKKPDLQNVFSSIRLNAQSLMNLVTQILDLSRLDVGRLQLKKDEVGIVSCLKNSVLMLQPLAAQKNIQVIETHPSSEHILLADRSILEKVLNNLLSNAIKYTPSGGQVYVSCQLTDGMLHIQVKDTGIGIPQDLQSKIFERFYRVNEEGEGTGIGLALTKELVNLHRGRVEVESEPGQGTVFDVFIPVETVGTESLQKSSSDPEFSTSAPVGHNPSFPMHDDYPVMLVVEDHPELRDYIANGFQGMYRVLAAADGEQGLEMALATVPDIIITDWMMPGMSGADLCSKLKSTEITSHIPIVLLTARASADSKIEGLETGADDYISKPFEWNELEARVRNLVQQRKLLQEKFMHMSLQSYNPVKVVSIDERFMKKFYEEVERQLSNAALTVEDLSKEVGVSRAQLHRKLIALTGHSAGSLLKEYRLHRAADLLRQKAGNVSEIAYQVGIDNLSYFTKAFKQKFRVLPSEYSPK